MSESKPEDGKDPLEKPKQYHEAGVILDKIKDLLGKAPTQPGQPAPTPPNAAPGPLDGYPVLKRILEVLLYLFLAFLAMRYGIEPRPIQVSEPIPVVITQPAAK